MEDHSSGLGDHGRYHASIIGTSHSLCRRCSLSRLAPLQTDGQLGLTRRTYLVKEKRTTTFTTSALFVVTLLIAIHCAFPFLINAFFATLLSGIVLLCFPFAPVYMAFALFSKQKGNHLDVDNNKFCVIWNNIFVGVVVIVYLVMVLLYGFASSVSPLD